MTRPKEIAFNHYPHALALCDCEPTHTWGGIPSISVRRSGKTDRCMECNKRWPAAPQVGEQSEMALVVPCPKFAERNTPCVPVDGVCGQCGNKPDDRTGAPESASDTERAKLPEDPRKSNSAKPTQSTAMGPNGPKSEAA